MNNCGNMCEQGKRCHQRPGICGLIEEERMRTALRNIGLDVVYSAELDRLKVDALVSLKANPPLPPVGLQYTRQRSGRKQRKAIEVVRKTRIVSRFLYLSCRLPITERVTTIIHSLLMFVAEANPERGIMAVVLDKDPSLPRYIVRVRSFPIWTSASGQSNGKERVFAYLENDAA